MRLRARLWRPSIAHPIILVTALLDATGAGIVAPVLPGLVRDVGGGDIARTSYFLGMLISVYAVAGFLVGPLLGRMSDHFGRRPMILASLAASCVDYLVAATTHSIVVLGIARVIAGVCGASIVVANAYVADVTPPEKRGASFGQLGATFGLGMIVGPTLGGALGELGLRAPFWAAMFVTLVNLCCGIFVLAESLPSNQRRALSLRGINPVSAVLTLGRFELRPKLIAALILIQLATTMAQATMVLFTQLRLGWSSHQVGICLTVSGLFLVVVQMFITPFILPRLGQRRAVLLGFALTMLGYFGSGASANSVALYVSLAVMTLGFVSGPAIQSIISAPVPANQQGELMGSIMPLAAIVSAIGPLAGTYVFGYFAGPESPVKVPGAAFFAAGIMMLGALCCVASMPERRAAPLGAEAVSASAEAPE